MPEIADPKPTIVIRPTTDELRCSATILSAKYIAFLILAWRLDASDPTHGQVTGSMYFYPELDSRVNLRGAPQCILGSDPERPARADVTLASTPSGQAETRTASDLLRCDLYLTFPASPPWIKEPYTVHFIDGKQIPDANPPLRP